MYWGVAARVAIVEEAATGSSSSYGGLRRRTRTWERRATHGFGDGQGVEEGLVRVSVGTEDINQLMGWFTEAVEAAEYVAKQAR